jgi:hypothetical protein
MILVFSVWLEWLPTSGQGESRNLIMPAVALGWYFAASLLRLTRSSMIEVLRSEYVKLARGKGLPGYVVLAVHAFKKARNSSAGKSASRGTFRANVIRRADNQREPKGANNLTEIADAIVETHAACAGAQQLGTTLVDQSVLVLVPELYRAKNFLSGKSPVDPDSIIFLAGGFEKAAARGMAAQAGLARECEVTGTPLRVVTNHSMRGLEELTVFRSPK